MKLFFRLALLFSALLALSITAYGVEYMTAEASRTSEYTVVYNPPEEYCINSYNDETGTAPCNTNDCIDTYHEEMTHPVVVIVTPNCAITDTIEEEMPLQAETLLVNMVADTSEPPEPETVTASKTLQYHSRSGNLLWEMRLEATFTYSPGEAAVCQDVSYTVTASDSRWHVTDSKAWTAGSQAVLEASFLREVWGIPVHKETDQLTITCDEDGFIS